MNQHFHGGYNFYCISDNPLLVVEWEFTTSLFAVWAVTLTFIFSATVNRKNPQACHMWRRHKINLVQFLESGGEIFGEGVDR